MQTIKRLSLASLAMALLWLPACGDDEPLCGDGLVEGDEACDDGNTNQQDGCLDNCRINRCGDGFVWIGVEACDDGNDVDGDGCTNACTQPRCGDGVVQAGEQCDDGNLDERDACRSDCLSARCGDGWVQPGEACDDGNRDNHDSCLNSCVMASCGDGVVWIGVEACDDPDDAACTDACAPASCGDGVVQGAEECDDGNRDPRDGCTNACLDAFCGDGITRDDLVDPDAAGYEECDDANFEDGDGCTNFCLSARCGDGSVQVGVEECDDGNAVDDDGCSNACTRPRCGDGIVQAGEECDDGNADARDGCLRDCRVALCGDGIIRRDVTDPESDLFEACDDGDRDDRDACRNDCRVAFCGDGVVQVGVEGCDDGNDDEEDGCTSDCALPSCGDGEVQEGEACDDGNLDNTDDCLSTCQLPFCGDGFVQLGVEECDDANLDDGDRCLSDCTAARCGDGAVLRGVEACDDPVAVAQGRCTDECALPSCGDGVVQPLEACDDGNRNNLDDCLDTCQVAVCGDGWSREDVTDPADLDYEACDDGNRDNSDGCLNSCELAVCGDGVIQLGVEACDDNNRIDDDGCSNACQLPFCGDGIKQSWEACDDGDLDDGDDCLSNCTLPRCGDGIVHRGVDDCDDGNGIDGDACLTDCTAAACGDGVRWIGVEQCDDGNVADDDGCSSDCRLPLCGDGLLQIYEACDDGNQDEGDSCLNDCSAARCGDGVVWRDVEACDDGNFDDTDDCLRDCSLASCGDGFIHVGVEGCDDGNLDNTDDCVGSCQPAYCGDGFVRRGVELCDDGNASNGDGCLRSCQPAACGDGFLYVGVEGCDDGNASDADACLSSCVAARCGDGVTWVGVEQCDDGNLDNTDECLATCQAFRWCEAYSVDSVEPPSVCADSVPDFIDLVGTRFYEIDGTPPTVTLDGEPLPASLDETSCEQLDGLLAEVSRCTRLAVDLRPVFALEPPLDTLNVGTYRIRVEEALTAGCADEVFFSVADAPVLTAILPTPICEGGRTLTLEGEHFVPGSVVELLPVAGGDPIEPDAISVNAEGTRIEATFFDLQPGFYDVRVSNGEGCDAFLTAPNNLEVVEQPLAVFVDPPLLFNGITIRVTIYLSNLQSEGVDFVGIRPEGSDVPFDPLFFVFDPSEPDQVQADVPSGLPPGVYEVLVRDAAGCEAPLEIAFRVTDQDNISLTGLDPPFGERFSPTTISVFADDDPADPAVNGFVSLPTVYITPTGGGSGAFARRLSSVSFKDAEELTAQVPRGLDSQRYDLIVINPEGADGEVGVLEGAFLVTGAKKSPPRIVRIAPFAVPRAGDQQDVFVDGRNFRAGAEITLFCQTRDGTPLPDVLPCEAEPGLCTTTTVLSSNLAELSFDAHVLPEGAICVVRLTNTDNDTWNDYSALAIISPSLNATTYDEQARLERDLTGDGVFDYEPALTVARRGPAVTSGGPDNRNRYIYVMGGDDGTAAGSTASIELAILDRFGQVPEQGGFRELDPELWLSEPRALAQALTIGRFIYVVGGHGLSGVTSASTLRAEILRVADAPLIDGVSLRIDEVDGLPDPGVYYYRLSAVMPADDPDNPGGETLPSDPQPVRIRDIFDDDGSPLYLQVVLRWQRLDGDPTEYRIYRSPAPAASPGSEQLMDDPDGVLDEITVSCDVVGTCIFVDTGLVPLDPSGRTPRGLGDLGAWVALPDMHVTREAFGLAQAAEPDLAAASNVHLYAVAGMSLDGTSCTGDADCPDLAQACLDGVCSLDGGICEVAADCPDVPQACFDDACGWLADTYEVLTIDIDDDGTQTVTTPWRVGTDPADPGALNVISVARARLGVWGLDRTVTRAIINRDAWIYAGPGFDDSPVAGVVEVGQVLPGGLLTVWDADSINDFSRSGYGAAAAGEQLMAFGGRNPPSPGTRVDAETGEVCPDVGGVRTCPELVSSAWNNFGGASLTDPRYLMGTTVESAQVFIVGGVQSDANEPMAVSDTIDRLVW